MSTTWPKWDSRKSKQFGEIRTKFPFWGGGGGDCHVGKNTYEILFLRVIFIFFIRWQRTQCLWFWGSMTELEPLIQIGDLSNDNTTIIFLTMMIIISVMIIILFIIDHQPLMITRKVLTIEEIVLHPSYNHATSANDIALLKVFILMMLIMMMIFDATFPFQW